MWKSSEKCMERCRRKTNTKMKFVDEDFEKVKRWHHVTFTDADKPLCVLWTAGGPCFTTIEGKFRSKCRKFTSVGYRICRWYED